MGELLVSLGWLTNLLCSIWLGLIILDLVFSWIPSWQENHSGLLLILSKLVTPVVNMIRRTIPTVYRGIDFAPWITVVLLILFKTFAVRAVIYWGMLHR